MSKKKIIVDLDVVTIGIWKKADERKKEALKFINRVKNKEFDVLMLSSTLNIVDKWNHLKLGDSIKKFYIDYTTSFIEDIEILEYLKKQKISSNKIIDDLLRHHIKKEDIMLILACVSKKANFLVTLNRRHLRGKTKEIKEVLDKYKLPKINVVYPNEI